jgi:hypothetical protein
MEDPHRESCKRQHRIIGQYLAVQAWLRGLDCIVLVRSDLEVFLGLERFKNARVQWLKEDLTPWFPYQQPYYKTNSPSSIHSLYLSRVQIEKFLPSGKMTTDDRIARMKSDAPRTQRFSSGANGRQVPSNTKMVSYLAVLAAGLANPKKKRTAKRVGLISE